jgi:hypothetical protein
MDDRRIEEAVQALHQGKTPPKAAHFLMENVMRHGVAKQEALS